MRIIGCDWHARQQTLAMLDTATGEVVKETMKHEAHNVREFFDNLLRPVRVGIEATGSMQWFVNLMEELGIECLVSHPATIRAAEPRKQKHDRRNADLLLSPLAEDRFPAIWLPTEELLDLRALLRHRHQWVCLRVKIQNALQAIALAFWMWGHRNRNEGHYSLRRDSLKSASRTSLHMSGFPEVVSNEHLSACLRVPGGTCWDGAPPRIRCAEWRL